MGCLQHFCIVFELMESSLHEMLNPSRLSSFPSSSSSSSSTSSPYTMAQHMFRNEQTLDLNTIAKIALQLLCSLNFLHKRGIIHADLKPENILMNNREKGSEIELKLSDMGNAVQEENVKTYTEDFMVQSLFYRAPEVKKKREEVL